VKVFLTGANGVAEAIKRGCGTLLISRKSNRADDLERLADEHGVPIRWVGGKTLTRLTGNMRHRGYAMETSERRESGAIRSLRDIETANGGNSLVILLDGVTDPRNLGAVIRAAEQFRALAVIVPKRRSAGGGCGHLEPNFRGRHRVDPTAEGAKCSTDSWRIKGYGVLGVGCGRGGYKHPGNQFNGPDSARYG